MRDLLLVAAGGALGSAARYGVGRWMGLQGGAVPWPTLLVNATGAFAIGLLLVAARDSGGPAGGGPSSRSASSAATRRSRPSRSRPSNSCCAARTARPPATPSARSSSGSSPAVAASCSDAASCSARRRRALPARLGGRHTPFRGRKAPTRHGTAHLSRPQGHRRHAPGRRSHLGAPARRRPGPLRALRLRAGLHAGVRAHGRVRPRHRRGDRHRRQGDVHVPRQGEPSALAHAAPRGHRFDRPLGAGARAHRQRAEREALLRGPDVPLRAPAGGPHAPVLADRRRGARHGRAHGRRRGHRAAHGVLRRGRHPARPHAPADQLDGRRELPSALSRQDRRLHPLQRGRPVRGVRAPRRDQPAARVRLQERGMPRR